MVESLKYIIVIWATCDAIILFLFAIGFREKTRRIGKRYVVGLKTPLAIGDVPKNFN